MTKSAVIMILLIALLAGLASSVAIFYQTEGVAFSYQSIRGEEVEIYGKGLYRHMSSDVAIQGIAQDYITLFLAIPLMIFALMGTIKKSLKAKFCLAGIMLYFWITYTLYTAMAMYNIMFLSYLSIMALSFFSLLRLLLGFDLKKFPTYFSAAPTKLVGSFLIFISLSIGLLWLGIIVPPLIDGSLYPASLQHYTTLIVQGFDLGLFLPLAFVSGWLMLKKQNLGLLLGTVYIIFLALLMSALSAKIIAMGLNGVNIIPVVFIIPTFNLVSLTLALLLLLKIKPN
ncbi:MAG: hypothetical protein R6U84_04450 [Candidatus Cloacimonadales bacterium]